MPDFKVTCAPILELPRSAEVIIDGGVNATNAAALKDKLSASLDRKITYVSILMGNVAYVNSSGFGYFMDLAGMLERRGGALVLVEVQPKVKVVFNNLGMQNFFRFELSAENARAFLRAQAEKVARSPRMVPLNGPDENIEFPIVGSSIKIGGDLRSTIVLKHPEVEARHCEVYRTGDNCSVRDLGTRFGTFVGKVKINDQALHAGDIITTGPFRIAYYPAGVAHKV
ncbi:MAG TPA: STAS domain-containing protein [Planctomycetota bacterium]|jgi:anti-anti-sigma factor|nr:STAS domain-containing protein [Planctomycetota bacterium]